MHHIHVFVLIWEIHPIRQHIGAYLGNYKILGQSLIQQQRSPKCDHNNIHDRKSTEYGQHMMG